MIGNLHRFGWSLIAANGAPGAHRASDRVGLSYSYLLCNAMPTPIMDLQASCVRFNPFQGFFIFLFPIFQKLTCAILLRSSNILANWISSQPAVAPSHPFSNVAFNSPLHSL